MIPNTYGYLLGTIIFFIPWIFFFIKRKDLRKEMLLTSILVAFGSVFTAYYWWTVDWWHPQTITGTKVGIEDFLLGFSNGGIGAVAYEVVFKKRFYKYNDASRKSESLSVGLVTLALLSFGFWGLRMTSFWACVLALVAGIFLMFFYRKDLLINGIISGLLMMLISIPAYIIPDLVSPNLLNNSWYYHLLSGIRIIGIPIEDLIFYILFGIWIGPLYELYYSKKLKRLPKLNLKKTTRLK